MKKAAVILIMLMYGLSSFGITVHIHYCCGKIDAVNLSPVKKDNCPVKDKAAGRKCCDDRQIELKIKDSYSKYSEVKTWFKPLQNEKESLPVTLIEKPVSPVQLTCYSNTSPPYAPVPLHKLYCIYRI
jgi:hypothetical protein